MENNFPISFFLNFSGFFFKYPLIFGGLNWCQYILYYKKKKKKKKKNIFVRTSKLNRAHVLIEHMS